MNNLCKCEKEFEDYVCQNLGLVFKFGKITNTRTPIFNQTYVFVMKRVLLKY